ncbi:hypothetical protein ACFV9W_22240 [Streptomyces sp. NPDC059897]|uniref:hypothetical protein n=1 Tax=Streptomyces sp. NPDC059897 TaxID=3346994 RepID=UPI003651C937
MATRYCIRCGAGTEDARLSFCPRCGTAYAGQGQEPAPRPADTADDPSAYIRVGPTRLPRLLPVALLAVLVAAGTAVGVTLANRDDDTGPPPSTLASFSSPAFEDTATESVPTGPEPELPTEPTEPEETQEAQDTETAASVVESYYADLNAGDFGAAWDRGGSNIATEQTYDEWVSGFRTTRSITVDATDDGFDEVDVYITSTLTDGTTERYQGTYTVTDGEITAAEIQQAP